MARSAQKVPRSDVARLEELVRGGEVESLRRFLELVHPTDLADQFAGLHRDDRARLLRQLDVYQIAALMEQAPDDLRVDLAERLTHEQLTQVIAEMASDDAADLLGDLPDPLAGDLIEAMPREDQQEVESLLAHPRETAGGLMQLELVSVPLTATADQAVRAVRANAEAAGGLHFIYIVDEEDRLVGMISLAALILARPAAPLRELTMHDIHVVTPEVDQEHVARMFRRYDLVALPVVDQRGVLLGCIQHDDAVDVHEEEVHKDMLQMAGVAPAEPELVYTQRRLRIAAARTPWLMATLAGLSISALMYRQFQLTFPNLMALIPFIPVISAMGGNMGTQTSTIIVRGFATGRVNLHNLWRVFVKELFIGSLIGIVCGAVAGGVALLWRGDSAISYTVAVAMVASIMAAAAIGVLLPYLFRRLKVDPAVAAGPLVTTLEDIVGVAVYYLCAVLIIS